MQNEGGGHPLPGDRSQGGGMGKLERVERGPKREELNTFKIVSGKGRGSVVKRTTPRKGWG